MSSRFVPPAEPVTFKLVGKRHRQSITAVTVSFDDAFGFAASKDGLINQFDIETGDCFSFKWPDDEATEAKTSNRAVSRNSKRGKRNLKPSKHLLSLAVSSDGRYLSAGGFDRLVHVWDVRTRQHLQAFKGHRDAISAVVFRLGTNQLFSGSLDRSIKIWSIDDMAYIDSMFGHQSQIFSIDCLTQEKLLSSGGDRTCRIWKVSEEKQLLFKGHMAPIDCCRFIGGSDFLTGSEDGSLALWNVQRKKPVFLVKNAHKRKHSISQNRGGLNPSQNSSFSNKNSEERGAREKEDEDDDLDRENAESGNSDDADMDKNDDIESQDEPISFEVQLKLSADGASDNKGKITALDDADKGKARNPEYGNGEIHVEGSAKEANFGSEGRSMIRESDRTNLLTWKREILPPVVLPGMAEKWIQSISVVRNSDLFASGAGNGVVKIWQADIENKKIKYIYDFPAVGFVNSLAFASSGKFMLAGLGQEPRLGRWGKICEAKNGVILHTMNYS